MPGRVAATAAQTEMQISVHVAMDAGAASYCDADACTPPRHKRNRSAWQTINELAALGVQRDEVSKRKKAKSNDNDIMYLDKEPDGTPSGSQESVIE